METASNEEHFVVLETKIAYQEKLLTDLNEVVLDQRQTIEDLAKRLDRVERALQQGDTEEEPLPHDTPPHY